MKTGKRDGRGGYSLVEVTLALLVVAVGLTATFAVFPEAMKNTRESVNATEVGLFADYVFASLAVASAVYGDDADVADTGDYLSMVLSKKDKKKVSLEEGKGKLFYWIPKDDDQGTGDWDLTQNAGFWTTAFTYDLEWDEMVDKNRDDLRHTLRATLRVWPGEWKKRPNEKKNPPYVFSREILPYPDL